MGYDFIDDYKNGYAIVFRKGFYGIIDEKKEEILPLLYSYDEVIEKLNFCDEEKLLDLKYNNFNFYDFSFENLSIIGKKTFDKLSDKDQKTFLKKMTKELENSNYYYCDNFRLAIKGDIKSEKDYKKLAGNGCCGFYDKEILLDTTKIIFGFNFGH